ncbi:MAG TPA: AMP-binding protein, partial [Blastocatellia bacterium]|nr:AMP-binding protein [Blastocatellia bacterium]
MPDKQETLIDLLEGAVARRADEQVLRFRKGENWAGITGRELQQRVKSLAAGLHSLGIKKGDAVALLAEGGPLWTITDFAILSLGAINIPFYPTQAIHQVEYILEESKPALLFLSGEKLARRVGPVLDRFPDLRLASFEPLKRFPSALVLENIERQGADLLTNRPTLYEELSSQVKASDLASIIYTSGTTGEPKGVMLAHSNIVFNAIASGEYL